MTFIVLSAYTFIVNVFIGSMLNFSNFFFSLNCDPRAFYHVIFETICLLSSQTLQAFRSGSVVYQSHWFGQIDNIKWNTCTVMRMVPLPEHHRLLLMISTLGPYHWYCQFQTLKRFILVVRRYSQTEAFHPGAAA